MEYPPLHPLSLCCRLGELVGKGEGAEYFGELIDGDHRVEFANACKQVQESNAQGSEPSQQTSSVYRRGSGLIRFAASLKTGEPAEMLRKWREALKNEVTAHIQSGHSLGDFPLSGCYLLAVFAPQRDWNNKITSEEVLKTIQQS